MNAPAEPQSIHRRPLAPSLPGVSRQGVRHPPAPLQGLLANQVDAILIGLNPALVALERNPEIEIFQRVKNPWGGAIAIRKGPTNLVAAIDQQINAMYADCTIVRLYEQYLPGQQQDAEVLEDHPESARCWEGSPAAPQTG